jgi:hypothetical protein
VLCVVGSIDYQAYGTIFMHATFRPKIKRDVFFFTKKAIDACREVVQRSSTAYFVGTQNISCHERIPQGLRMND